ncbi:MULTISPECIES: sigma-54 dependent transcriptional regulator [unclassified Treponema]|uniref:sigma-54-dependent transcriptional regulator n=1 Tax=unclassified Treponema TaxID=2638727 RepID=UPI0020A5F5BD|nr:MULTISPECIES: sigma-54 dependent transcriptional regulator [unclassified Treponema]UTC68347.1 sigma-54-dependent Fis family transcriptional regulator [Treponema sp. OMZ 789]UTC71067.1 sigma-54-dependent Fis family transcriptional regulator [Treponema sp. OMZ 790]UTC73808.1 sigma-54-dependent Fis family transcriptional regulator [Treponema sp. OMZ 791]
MKFTVLVIDDEKNIREGLAMALEDEGYGVITADNGKTGLDIALKEEVDLVITDLRMPELSGEDVLREVISKTPGVPVIVLTGHGTVETAVEAMRMGAYDFLTKPLDLERLFLLVKRALQNRALVLQNRALLHDIETKQSFENIIGKSPLMEKVFEDIKKVAPTKASVLITGETGVGKELIARAIHNLSNRKDKPFVQVHCASFAESLLESELFGHEKGAFTGAVQRTRGRFEIANGGTLFLDEIGEVNQMIQVKLLRVLQEKKFERVGGTETLSVDTRIIAATNRDLIEEIKKGNFREDLYFRLNVVHIHVPPLRERKEDIPLLAAAFIKEFAEENDKKIDSMEPRARTAIYNYEWPGNIRQLQNCIQSAVVMSSDNVIHFDDLPAALREKAEASSIRIPMGVNMAEAEKQIILQTLANQNNNKSKTADILGIGRRTLHRKLDEYAAEIAEDTAQMLEEKEAQSKKEKSNGKK